MMRVEPEVSERLGDTSNGGDMNVWGQARTAKGKDLSEIVPMTVMHQQGGTFAGILKARGTAMGRLARVAIFFAPREAPYCLVPITVTGNAVVTPGAGIVVEVSMTFPSP